MKKLNIIVITLIIFILGCSSSSPTAEKQSKTVNQSAPFEIYLAKPLKYGQDLKTVELQEEPIMTLEDIESYNWENHTIELTDEYYAESHKVVSRTKDYDGSRVLGTNVNDFFVLVVNGKRICLGGFRPFTVVKTKDFMPINIIDVSNNKIRIDINLLSSFSLHDPRLYDVLSNYGKLTDDTNSIKR